MKKGNGGFLQIIVLIVIALVAMKIFGVTVSDVTSWLRDFWSWFKHFFGDVLR